MSEVRLRRAGAPDLPAVRELLAEMERHQRGWRIFVPRPGAAEEVMARYRAAVRDPDALHLLAEVDGRVVGMALATVHRPSSFSDTRSVEVSSFVVRSSHRRRGVGRTLLEEIVRFARERGVPYLDLRVFAGNDGAIAFWDRMGFRSRMVQMVARVEGDVPAEP